MTKEQRTAARLLASISLKPSIALVLGSGFQGILHSVQTLAKISFEKLPGFPRVRVAGHKGNLIAGLFGGVPALILCGRAHYYEGRSMSEVAFPVRVLAEAGIQTIVLTNASGGINARFR